MWYNEPITLRKKSALDDLRARYGNRLWEASLDVTDSEAVRQVVNRAFSEMGQIDIVAGYGRTLRPNEFLPTASEIRRQ